MRPRIPLLRHRTIMIVHTAQIHEHNGTDLYVELSEIELKARVIRDHIEEAVEAERVPDNVAVTIEQLITTLPETPSVEDLQQVIDAYTRKSERSIVFGKQDTETNVDGVIGDQMFYTGESGDGYDEDRTAKTHLKFGADLCIIQVRRDDGCFDIVFEQRPDGIYFSGAYTDETDDDGNPLYGDASGGIKFTTDGTAETVSS